MTVAKNILLTGLPRVGKTTVIQKILARGKVKYGGFYTQALDPEARRRNFKLVTLEGNNREFSRKELIRRFEVEELLGLDLEELEKSGVEAIRRALVRCQVVVIDEIGRHEALSVPFRQAVEQALDSARPVLASVPLYGTPYIEGLKARADVQVIEVTGETRVLLADRIAQSLRDLTRTPIQQAHLAVSAR